MKKNTTITNADITTTNATPVVLTDARRPWARTTPTTDDFVVLRDGTVCRRSAAIASDTDPWDNRH